MCVQVWKESVSGLEAIGLKGGPVQTDFLRGMLCGGIDYDM